MKRESLMLSLQANPASLTSSFTLQIIQIIHNYQGIFSLPTLFSLLYLVINLNFGGNEVPFQRILLVKHQVLP